MVSTVVAAFGLLAPACWEPAPRSADLPRLEPPPLEAPDAAPDATADGDLEPPEAPPPAARGLLSELVVEPVSIDYGEPEERWGRALWDTFANSPLHEKFSAVSTADWHANFLRHEARLVALARARGFDAEALASCFKRIEPEPYAEIALLPIGAFLARRGREPVWIIVCNWEWSPSHPSMDGGLAGFGHIRAWAFSARDCRQLDYMTCG